MMRALRSNNEQLWGVVVVLVTMREVRSFGGVVDAIQIKKVLLASMTFLDLVLVQDKRWQL